MKPSLRQKDGQQARKCLPQSQDAHWALSTLEFSGQSCAKVTLRGHIEWATTSARKFLQRYWPMDTEGGNRLPRQICRWITVCRKRLRLKDKSQIDRISLVINRPSARLTVRYRYMCDSACSVLLFEEHMVELSRDRLVSLGLTSREAEVVQWLVQGKSSYEIATILTISVRTVSKHLERIYLRLGVENRHAAVTLMYEELRQTDPQT